MNAFGNTFTIYKKRNTYGVQFLGYWDGRESASGEWDDTDTNDNDLTPSSATLMPYGYRSNGSVSLSGNFSLSADTTKFTAGVVITRNDDSNNEGIIYSALGSSHYPRVYFVGTTLHAEVQLNGVVKSISVSNTDSYITVGQPTFIVLRGDATTGIELLIDNTVRGSNTDTGTDFDASNSNTVFMQDSDKSYDQKGELRFAFVTQEELSDDQLTVFLSMLNYEGYFDVVRDTLSKWTGSGDITTASETTLTSSPYVARLIET